MQAGWDTCAGRTQCQRSFHCMFLAKDMVALVVLSWSSCIYLLHCAFVLHILVMVQVAFYYNQMLCIHMPIGLDWTLLASGDWVWVLFVAIGESLDPHMPKLHVNCNSNVWIALSARLQWWVQVEPTVSCNLVSLLPWIPWMFYCLVYASSVNSHAI